MENHDPAPVPFDQPFDKVKSEASQSVPPRNNNAELFSR